MRKMSTFKKLIPVLIAVPLLLTGCTTAQDQGGHITITDQHLGLAKKGFSSEEGAPTAWWTTAAKQTITLTNYGSSSCPNVPTAVVVKSATRADLPLKTYSGACTADLAAYTVTFKAPAALSRSKNVVLMLTTTASNTTSTPVTVRPDVNLQTLKTNLPVTATPIPQPVIRQGTVFTDFNMVSGSASSAFTVPKIGATVIFSCTGSADARVSVTLDVLSGIDKGSSTTTAACGGASRITLLGGSGSDVGRKVNITFKASGTRVTAAHAQVVAGTNVQTK